MSDGMARYIGKYKPDDVLFIKEGDALQAAYDLFSDLPDKSVYWYPKQETVDALSNRSLTVESCYFFHGGYPIYVLVFEMDGQEYEARVCEAFLDRQKAPAATANVRSASGMLAVNCHSSNKMVSASSLFVHLLAPDAAESPCLSSDFKLYIQAIALGILKRQDGSPDDAGYCFSVSGEELLIGSEKVVRKNGLIESIAQILHLQVVESVETIRSVVQCSALIALYDFHAGLFIHA
jgi:hypothetical protein